MSDAREAQHAPQGAEGIPLPYAPERAHDWPASDLPATKRRRATEARGAFPRKRAVTACDLCRLRKTKCDNQRPRCGRCAASEATCVFRDGQIDHSTFDPASLTILERLNYAIDLLEAQPANKGVPPSSSQRPVLTPNSHETGSEQDPGLGSHLQHGATSVVGLPSDEASLEDEARGVSSASTDTVNVNARCSSTYVLEWPVFDGLIPPDTINPRQDGVPCDVRRTVDPARHDTSVSAKSTASILNDDILTLVDGFLRNVHTKNPIFDPADLYEIARAVAEDGFQWDVGSCLMLIVCALGILSTPWSVAMPKHSETSLVDTQSYPRAETYYLAARKRLGLLDSSITAIQCWFLTGVYEMYSMRPMSAWLSFNRACTMFQLHVHAQNRADQHGLGPSGQRLYWSCLKSECELREEFDLPPPGLQQVEYPDALPSPPSITTNTKGRDADGRGEWGPVDESSWFYYLSDVAYRRITNRIITTIYGSSKEQWLSADVGKLHRIARELDNQIVQWWEHIPGSPAPVFQPDMDELTYMLWLNYVDIRERLWRPFLFIAANRHLSEAERPIVMAGARQCLTLSFDALQGARLKHRHHGLWLTVRCMFTKALLVLAAVRSRLLEIRDDWRSTLNLSRSTSFIGKPRHPTWPR